MPIIHKLPINLDNDDVHYEVLVNRQVKENKKYDTARNYDSFSIGSTVDHGAMAQWFIEGPITITTDPT